MYACKTQAGIVAVVELNTVSPPLYLEYAWQAYSGATVKWMDQVSHTIALFALKYKML